MQKREDSIRFERFFKLMGPTSTQKLIDTIRTEKNLKLMVPALTQKLIVTIRIEKNLKLMVPAPTQKLKLLPIVQTRAGTERWGLITGRTYVCTTGEQVIASLKVETPPGGHCPRGFGGGNDTLKVSGPGTGQSFIEMQVMV